MTPAQELRAAAERLRDLAAGCSVIGGPWQAWPQTAVVGVGLRSFSTPNSHTAEWIATLSPAIAEPLALWLDTHVQWAQDVQVVFFEPDTGEVVDIDAARWPGLAAALAFARAIPSPTGNPGGET